MKISCLVSFLRINLINTLEAFLKGFKIATSEAKQNDKFKSTIYNDVAQNVTPV